ncbi:MAG: hypothetical protein OEM62_08820 [Acidobacteriota bacterium]|nr:hypothetical protein [Acidobacteriota bacterium]
MRKANVWLTTLAVIALIAALATPAAWAKRLEDAEVYFEINDTDGDAGIHVFLDGVGWDMMQMTGPNGVEFSVLAESGVGMQGITEFFFESAEPSFEEQSLDELLALFPEGRYRFIGTTTEGNRLRGKARLNHSLPDAPILLFPAEGDEVDPDDAVFSWGEVDDPAGGEIDVYQVVVECEEPGSEIAVEVPADILQITIPPEIFEGQEECKWEVLAVEEYGNRTISEAAFDLE